MILVVDDEPGILRVVKRALEPAGFRVVTCENGQDALDEAAKEEPELIISDIVMPKMDGHAFRAAYLERFPFRRTPFVFFSVHTEDDRVVKALDEGADDYLFKPIEPKVLRARVRALLRRSRPKDPGRFRGNLAELSLVQVLQHCERNALTGTVEFRTEAGNTTVRFEAGEMVADDATSDKIAELMDLEEGSFVIESRPIPFEPIADSRIFTMPPPAPPDEIPMGRLSGVRAGDRVFQLQTEYEPPPVGQIVTVVILEGKVLQKHSAAPPPGTKGDALRALMDEQHDKVEAMVRDRVEQATRKKIERAPAPAEEAILRQAEATPAPTITESREPVKEPAPAPKPAPEPEPAPPAAEPAPTADGHADLAAETKALAAPEPPRDLARIPEPPDERPVPPPLSRPEDRLYQATTASTPAAAKDRLFEAALRKWRERDLAGAHALLEHALELCPDDLAVKATLDVVQRRLRGT